MAKPIFERINITTRGSRVNSETSTIGFSPIVEYVHYGGGRNGTEYIWSSLYFNLTKGEWDFERSRQIFNKAETHKKENQTVEIKTIERNVLDKVNALLAEIEATIYNDKILSKCLISKEYGKKADRVLCFVLEKLKEIKSFRGNL